MFVEESADGYDDNSSSGGAVTKEETPTSTVSYMVRYVHMSKQFANAYVAFMVQSGEGLGHEEVAELVQDEEVIVSSMLAHDAGVTEVPMQQYSK